MRDLATELPHRSKCPVERFPGLELILVESGGDNLAATFSPELSDLTLYVIDVAAGDKIPRKGGPGICRSDLLLINKIDLAPHVGASLEVMERDSKRVRGERVFLFTDLRKDTGLDAVIAATAVTWVVWSSYLGLRVFAGWTGRRAAYLALVGFVLVVVVRVVLPESHFT